MSIHQARTALKLGKATEYPVDAKDDSDLRYAVQLRDSTKSQAKKNPEILTFVGLPDF
ncbi:hypothetical protein [Pseudomonas fluorescens]|uniref:hypothetical protein n=1 Tax=Pseudomonas fluorescens TaxID=294 RepID=UPI001C124E88|nr:hypothetical protein [Pseudomonas fluorescens]